jgi:hypothetical protein
MNYIERRAFDVGRPLHIKKLYITRGVTCSQVFKVLWPRLSDSYRAISIDIIMGVIANSGTNLENGHSCNRYSEASEML